MTSPNPQENIQWEEPIVVKINRCAAVVKGGRRFSFSAVVVIGNKNGKVGVGFGKANEVPAAVQKATKDAQKNAFAIPLIGDTIPHIVVGEFATSKVFMKPACEGTGVIAGAVVRALAECAGIKNVLTKAYGSTTAVNLIKAATNALKQLRNKAEVERLRGIKLG